MYNQASENDLNHIISDEINEYLMLSEEEREPAFYKFQDLIQDWWKKPKSSTYLTDSYVDHNPLRKTLEHIKDMRMTTLMKERRSEIDKLGLKFCDTALGELENVIEKKKVTLILTPQYSMKITSAKIHQYLNAEYGVLKIEDFNYQETDILNTDKFRVIVMHIEKSSQHFDVICLTDTINLQPSTVHNKSLSTVFHNIFFSLRFAIFCYFVFDVIIKCNRQ